MRKGRMYGQFENFKINENLFGNHSTVTGWQELFFLYIRRIRRSKEEREKIKTREGVGGEEREGTPVVPHRSLQSPCYFSSLSLLRNRPHYLKACPGKG